MRISRSSNGRALLFWWGVLVTLHLQAAATAKVTCDLHFQGHGARTGLKSAVLSCSGGTITAVAHPELLASFSTAFVGVSWASKGACAALKDQCVLTLCQGSAASFPKATVLNVNAPNTKDLICLGDSSSADFDNARFQGNTGRPLTVLSKYAG